MSTEIATFIAQHIPDEWFAGPVDVCVDREEILVVGELPDGVDPRAFREHTRDLRMRIATEAEARWLRKVSWGVRTGAVEHRFTTVSVPVMTRLRVEERLVLDALIDGGLARTRSEALSWCVRLVGRHQREWLDELREASAAVQRVRAKGPDLDA
jgi:hypothetical protein